jgi:hypothetical protein
MDKCDKCGSDILMGECSCGLWFENDQMPHYAKVQEEALLNFDKSGAAISSGDHHTGVCFVFFRGDYKKCMKVVKFVEELNNG